MDEDKLLSTNQIAKRLNVHRTTVNRWIRYGKLKAETEPTYFVRESVLKAFLEEQEKQNEDTKKSQPVTS